MSAKRTMTQLPDAAFVGLHSAMTMEEVDCERRGYKLTKTILGTGGYAKVKLAYVMEKKIEKDKRLAEDLAEKGHNVVGNLNVLFFSFSTDLFKGTEIKIPAQTRGLKFPRIMKKTPPENLFKFLTSD